MAEQLIVSVSGIRGIVGENFTARIAVDYRSAFGMCLKDRHHRNVQSMAQDSISICIGRDSRPSGEMLKSAATTGLCTVGINVIDLGIVTTPSVGMMVRELAVAGVVVITASHDPIAYNGIKLLLDNGIAPPSLESEKIKLCFFEKDFTIADSIHCGRVTFSDKTDATHIGEEYTLALAAKYIFSERTGNAATNLSTSRVIDDVAGKAGGKVIRTAVGEANVASAMFEHDCIIGGEGNGGVIDLRIGPVRDSLVGIALVMQLMAETGKTISRLVDEIGGYYMSKDKFSVDQNQARRILKTVKETFAGAKLDTSDGCRFDFDHSWLHLRASNTEPVMRLIVEAKDRITAQKYIDQVTAIRTKTLIH